MAKPQVRYGAEVRKRAKAVSETKRKKYVCPACGKKKVRRSGFSRWKCRSCGSEFAGGAYSLSTAIGETVSRLVKEAG